GPQDLEDAAGWGRKVILATHGGDNLGSILYFGFKMAINAGLLAANIYFFVGHPTVVPETCTQIYGFPRGAFVASMDARDTLFGWTRPYRTMTVTIPFMALLMKDL